jgi:hypothetical protein
LKVLDVDVVVGKRRLKVEVRVVEQVAEAGEVTHRDQLVIDDVDHAVFVEVAF